MPKQKSPISNLVVMKRDDIFTTSLIIAEGTGINHRRVKDAIRKHENRLKSFGLSASYQAESTGGRPERGR